MLNAAADDIAGNVAQAIALEKAGCQIVRVAIPNRNAVALIPAIKEAVAIPLVADIHFDYRLALEAAAAGIDKIRINPEILVPTTASKLWQMYAERRIFPFASE